MTLASKITAIRLLLGPLFVLAFVGYGIAEDTGPVGSILHPLAGMVILCLSEFSDWLDGWFARRRGTVSEHGALLDGYADSIARLTFLTCFWWQGRLVPPWMVLLAYYHDALGFFLRNLVREQNLVLKRRLSGRIMEAMLAAIAPAVVLGMLFWHVFQPRLAWVVVERIAWWGALAVAATAVYAAADYVVGNAEALRRVPR